MDESCLSAKLYFGHVNELIDQCDYILIPRVVDFGVRRVSSAVWILSRLSSKINIPNAAKREDSLNLEPIHKTAIPSTIKKMPHAKSYWNARQYKSFEK